MNKITCPHCKKEFELNNADYADILNQVRTNDFFEQVKSKVELEKKNFELERIAELKQKESEINELNIKLEKVTDNNESIKAKLELEHEKSINLIKEENSKEIKRLNSQISDLKNIVENNKANLELELRKEENKQKDQITKLKIEIEKKNSEIKLLKQENESTEQKAEIEKTNAVNILKETIKQKDEEILQLKDYKHKMSTKMVGETLEQHCLTKFNEIRQFLPQGKVSFGKDNDAKEGSKGDFIYREMTDAGEELISIMFEMKNEMEETEHKHKNKDFYKELDKDRRQKKCEYAVLVSTLEYDNDEFNAGIVAVASEQYEKMFVVRPNCFIPIISLLRSAALTNASLKDELLEQKNRNIDITNFEKKLHDAKKSISNNYDSAKKNLDSAIRDIDATIEKLKKTKDEIEKSLRYFDRTNSGMDDLTIRKLTRGNPTMKSEFEKLEEEKAIKE